MTRLVLASASPGRRKVLRQAGIDPLVVVSGVDEDAVAATLERSASPAEVTTSLATAKASAVVQQIPAQVAMDCVVVGCDSMLHIDGQLRGKPGSAKSARLGWKQMAGKSGQLFTGHCVIRLQDNVISHQVADFTVTTVRFANPPPADLDAYVDTGEPISVAGGFTLDGFGGWFIDGVDGDPSSVVGIGLPLTRRLLEHTGLSISVLWQANPITTQS
jgi:septum formation protein